MQLHFISVQVSDTTMMKNDKMLVHNSTFKIHHSK